MKLKNTLFFGMIVMAFVAIFSAFVEKPSGYAVGDKAEDFSLKNVDGKMVSLANYKKAKGFIVVFTCNHCPYSVAYEQRIMDLDKMFKAKGYPVIAINPNDPAAEPDDSFDKMVELAKKKKYSFPYLFDDGQKVFPKYGATRTPHVFVLSKNNKDLTVEYIGAIDNNTKDASKADKLYVQDAVNALLKGQKPEVTMTKAVGCSIKVKKD
jgi:peroxiredoxin